MRSLVGQRRQRVNRSFLLGFVLFVVGIVLATVLAIPVIASSQDFKARESAIVRVHCAGHVEPQTIERSKGRKGGSGGAR
jgi:hypothetical protein